MRVGSVLNGMVRARARATRTIDACIDNAICSDSLLIDKITNKKERFKDNEVNTYDKNHKQQ